MDTAKPAPSRRGAERASGGSREQRAGVGPREQLNKMTRWLFLIVVALTVLLPARPAAHDIPADVLVNMFVKPEGNRLRLLVRVPLGAMRDMNLPLHNQS